jgi:Large ribosomal RNA subunit accumulation protein YceD
MINDPHGDFPRPVPAHDLPVSGRSFQVEARPDERSALARRFGILAVERLSAEGLLRPEAAGRRVKLEGRLVARVVQTCVVTLEPVAADIDVPFERLYGFDVAEEWSDEVPTGEVHLNLADDLPLEPLASGVLDIGAATAEQLALELDPYPRAPGAEFAGLPSAAENADDDVTTQPGLAALARWRKGREPDP